jgi:outer membrane protein assembly factor BamB
MFGLQFPSLKLPSSRKGFRSMMSKICKVVCPVVLAGVLGITFAKPTAADNWPRFRGPNGAGVASTRDFPTKWTESNILWRTDIPGDGHSSPVIWEKRLFIQCASTDAKSRSLLCYGIDDGKLLWKRDLPGGPAAKLHKKNSLASSTPAVDADRVYCLSWDGAEVTLHAFDHQGKPTWRQQIGKFTGDLTEHGYAASPIVHDGKVIVFHDVNGGSTVFAFDSQTGQLAWKTPRDENYRVCYSTPFVLEPAGRKPQIVVGSSAGLAAFNPDNGKEVWNFTWDWSYRKQALRTIGQPILVGDVVLLTSGEGGQGRHTIAVKVGDAGDVSKTHLVWELKKGTPYVPSMVADSQYAYFVTDQGIAGCIDPKNGTILWDRRLDGDAKVWSSPVLVDGNLFIPTEDGAVHVLQAGPEYKFVAKNKLGDSFFATPAIADNRMFLRGGQQLFCIGK